MIRPDRMTIKAQEAFRDAGEEARRLGNPVVNDAHLLLALLQQPEGVTATALAGHHADIDDVGDPAPDGEPEPADPVTDLIRQHQVVLGERGIPGIGIVAREIGEPRGEVFAIAHLANRQVAFRLNLLHPVTSLQGPRDLRTK